MTHDVNRYTTAFAVMGLVLAVSTRSQGAEPTVRDCADDARARPSSARRGVAIAGAVFPGVIVHGTGHWIAAEPCTAGRIAAAEAVGLGGAVAGGSTIVLTGASRYLMLPAITLTIAGMGLFITSFAADLYGVSGAARYAGQPERVRPRWETEAGLWRVKNPSFDFEWLFTQAVAANIGVTRLSGAMETALDGRHACYRLGVTLRAYGPQPVRLSSFSERAAPDSPRLNSGGVVTRGAGDEADRGGMERAPRSATPIARDGSFFDVYAGFMQQNYLDSHFLTESAELLATGRLDLVRIGPTLRGSFAELSTGIALARTRYRLDGLRVPGDQESVLLGRLAFGVYLGRHVHRGSEAMLYYDHRHDDYAAGTKVPGLGSGVIGHFGLRGQYYFSEHWGASAFLEVGSARIGGINVLFRSGGGR